MNPIHGQRVVQLLLKRWWTTRDLGRALSVQSRMAYWHVQQIARGRVVFARRTQIKRPGARGPNPLAYRLYLEAFRVQGVPGAILRVDGIVRGGQDHIRNRHVLDVEAR